MSVDAANNESYAKMKYQDKIDTQNGFDNVINNMRGLINYRDKNNGSVDVNVGFVVNQFNYNEIYDLAKIIKDIGVHYFRLKTDIASIMMLGEENQKIVKEQIEKVKCKLNDEYFQIVCIHRLDQPKDKMRQFDYSGAH